MKSLDLRSVEHDGTWIERTAVSRDFVGLNQENVKNFKIHQMI